jgi:hypothetical protein
MISLTFTGCIAMMAMMPIMNMGSQDDSNSTKKIEKQFSKS